jgi:hypothetical protein
MNLLKVESPDEFKRQVDALVKAFPKTAPFFKWWTSKEHASMLFNSKIKDKTLFNNLQDTTNAAESMHNKIYLGCGGTPRKKPKMETIEGLNALVSFLEYMRGRYLAASSEFLSQKLRMESHN